MVNNMKTSSEAFRAEVRSWLAEQVPQNWREAMTGVDQAEFVEAQKSWFFKLIESGYATPHWPAEWHGGGRSLQEQKIIYEELARADAPRLILYFVSLYHAACTLFECGSEAQQKAHLPGILKGEIWCQGFSEPNAGSDLASLRTKAGRDGDHYVINGQKIWSTMAQYADRCLLLVRTDRSGVPQAGLTYLLLDMKTPGITVKPINQITGDDEFAEIFFDDVRVPVSDRIGEEGAGWAIAQTTLASERGLTLVELSLRMKYSLPRLAQAIREAGFDQDSAVIGELNTVIAEVDACCALANQYLQGRIEGRERVGDASLVKLHYAATLRLLAKLGLRVSKLSGQSNLGCMRGAPQETGMWMLDFMNSYNWSIAGGSNEIQQNIVAERMLMMPREPKSWVLG